MKRSTWMVVMMTLPLVLAGCEYDRQQPGADETQDGGVQGMEERDRDQPAREPRGRDDGREEAADAEELVREAATVVNQMRSDPGVEPALSQVKGVLIVPNYGEGAVVVGARGGEGVLVARTNGNWSPPAFYDVGAVSLGAQVGGTGGNIAMLIMSDAALENFLSNNNFSLNADAGFTLVDYSAQAQKSWGKGEDVVFWSDTEGAFAGVSLSVTDIGWDEEENRGYHGRRVQPGDVLTGKVDTAKGDALTQALTR